MKIPIYHKKQYIWRFEVAVWELIFNPFDHKDSEAVFKRFFVFFHFVVSMCNWSSVYAAGLIDI